MTVEGPYRRLASDVEGSGEGPILCLRAVHEDVESGPAPAVRVGAARSPCSPGFLPRLRRAAAACLLGLAALVLAAPPALAQNVTAPCSDGVIIPDAADNLELVADCEALWAARDVLNPAGNALRSWNADNALWNWIGVTVGGSPQRADHFHLSNNRLSGSIPPELADIDNLGGFFLDNNQLTGAIPDKLKDANGIYSFHVQNNQLSGRIPGWIGNKGFYQELYLDGNRFTGVIPDLSGMNSLWNLRLGGNSLSGCVADSLKDQIRTRYSSTAPYGDMGAPFCADGTLPGGRTSSSTTVTIADASEAEGDSLTFTVTLDNAVSGGLTVTPSFTDVTATEGTDYTANTAALTFTGTAGETQSFTVATAQDTDVEADETFTVGLAVSGTTAEVTATDTATGTISNDDGSAAVTIEDEGERSPSR
ncbi:MAG: hypothetical protein OXH75_03605 [Acidobacteria bacterium]|nr:hypothetical protein [Acidobacteriota bacterium]